MKTRLLLSLVLCFALSLTACQPIRPIEPVTAAPILTAQEQHNLAVIQNFYDEFARGNLAVLPDVYAEQYTKHFAGQAGQLSLQQAYDELSTLKFSLPDLHVEIKDIAVQGDLVVTEMAWVATLNGDFLGIPTTSQQSHHRGLIVRRLQAGKIVEEWDLFDNLSLLQSLGYLPGWAAIIAQGPISSPTRPPAPSDAVFVPDQVGLTAQEHWHQKLVQRLYENYAAGNTAGIGKIMAEQVKIHQTGPAKMTTAVQLQSEFAALKAANPNLQPLVHSITAQGNLVVVELTWIGTHTGEYVGIPATGRTIVRDGLVVYRLQADKIDEIWEIWDDLGFLQSVGYLPGWGAIIDQGQ